MRFCSASERWCSSACRSRTSLRSSASSQGLEPRGALHLALATGLQRGHVPRLVGRADHVRLALPFIRDYLSCSLHELSTLCLTKLVVACGCLTGCLRRHRHLERWRHGLWRRFLHSRRFSACDGSFLDSRFFCASKRCFSVCWLSAVPSARVSAEPARRPTARGLEGLLCVRHVAVAATGAVSAGRRAR